MDIRDIDVTYPVKANAIGDCINVGQPGVNGMFAAVLNELHALRSRVRTLEIAITGKDGG